MTMSTCCAHFYAFYVSCYPGLGQQDPGTNQVRRAIVSFVEQQQLEGLLVSNWLPPKQSDFFWPAQC